MEASRKKVVFAGVGSPGKSLKTWPKSGFRTKSPELSEPEPASSPVDSETTVSKIFHGSLNLQHVDHESLFHTILTSLETTTTDTLGQWVVLNALLKGEELDCVDSDQAEFILHRAKLQIEMLSESCDDVLASRLLIQTLRVADTLLAMPDVEGTTDPELVQALLEQCTNILEQRNASKALSGAAIHVVNHVHDGTQHLGVQLSRRLIASFGITRCFSLGSVLGEFLSCCAQIALTHPVIAGAETNSWVPLVVRGLIGNSAFVRSQAAAVLRTCARTMRFDDRIGRAFETVLGATTTSSLAAGSRPASALTSSFEGEPVIRVLGYRITSQMLVPDEAPIMAEIWSNILLLVVCSRSVSQPDSEWPYLGRWLDIVRTPMGSPDIKIREACLVAWRIVLASFTFTQPNDIVPTISRSPSKASKSPTKSANGLLQPLKEASTADETLAPHYWQLFYTVLYSAMSIPQPNFVALWDSIVAPISRIFFESSNRTVRRDALHAFIHLVIGACDGGRVPQWNASCSNASEQLRRRLEPLEWAGDERLGLSNIAPLPAWWVRENQSRVLTFFATIVEDCNLPSLEILSLWQCVVRITSSELQHRESSGLEGTHKTEMTSSTTETNRMKRIVGLIAFIQSNKTLRPLAPQLSRILLGKFGVAVLTPRKVNQANSFGDAVATYSERGTTSALSVLVAIVMRQCADISSAPLVLDQILDFSNTPAEAAQVVRCMFEAAASATEGIWQICAQKLAELQDSGMCDGAGHSSVLVDALTSALAIEPLPKSASTWSQWAQLFSQAVSSTSEDALLNIMDRVPGIAAASLLPLKATVLRERAGFDSALTRIAFDGSLLNASSVLDQVIADDECILPEAFSLELARLLILRNANAYDVDYQALAMASLRLLGPLRSIEHAGILLAALPSASAQHRQTLVKLWNDHIVSSENAHRISDETRSQARRIKLSLCPEIVIPVAVTPTRKNTLSEINVAKRNIVPMSDGSPVKRRRVALPDVEFGDTGVLSPPQSSETGLEDERPTRKQFNDESYSDDDILDSDPLSSSPPRPGPASSHETDLDRMRTIKRALLGMGSGDAFAGMKRSECEMMRNLLFNCLVRLKVRLSSKDID